MVALLLKVLYIDKAICLCVVTSATTLTQKLRAAEKDPEEIEAQKQYPPRVFIVPKKAVLKTYQQYISVGSEIRPSDAWHGAVASTAVVR